MSEPRGNWIWKLLRGKSRQHLDRLQRDLVMRPGTKSKEVGDPNQAPHMRIRTRNK